MTRSRSIYAACAVASLMFAPAELRAQRSIDVFVGAGHTATDVEGWAKTRLLDWSQFLSDGHAQLFLLGLGPARLGVEAGHSDFMWYEYDSCPNCAQTHYADRYVAATRVLAVAQVGSRVFAELAGGVHMFDGFTDLGAYGGFGVRIPLVGRLELPIKARAGIILDSDEKLIPITLSGGLSYRLK
jgi:hypothetical protein